jgi:hypothetical protein
MQIVPRLQDEYETFLIKHGEEKLFEFLLKSGSLAKAHFEHPEIMLIDQSTAFFSLFRTTGNTNFFTIGRVLRRVSHKIYRENKKAGLTPVNNRFFNLV